MNQVIQFALRQEATQIQKCGAIVSVQANLPRAIGDFHQISTVFQNLIDNACKYAVEEQSPEISIGAIEEETRVLWSVKDNGVGIDRQDQERVFDLFQRVDRTVKGSGVGLALVKRIVEIHGGTIWVESEGKGHGAEFLFTLDQEAEWQDFEKLARG